MTSEHYRASPVLALLRLDTPVTIQFTRKLQCLWSTIGRIIAKLLSVDG